MARGTSSATRGWVHDEARHHRISTRTAWWLVVGPPVTVALVALLITLPPTREPILWLLAENRPVELATFLALGAAAVLGAREAWRSHTAHRGAGWTAFFALFATAAFVTGMEEIAWGQWFFGFATPAPLAEVNVQGETTLHNIGPLQGRSEIFRLTSGVLGLAGVALHRSARLRAIAVPRVLVPLFAVIVLHGLVDLVTWAVTLPGSVAYANRMLSEYVELLIGVAALAYVWLTTKRRRADRPV